MKQALLLFTLTFFSFSAHAGEPDNGWSVKKIEEVIGAENNPEGSVVRFNNGRLIQGSFFQAQYIGQLTTKKKAPYILLSARGCTDCDIELELFIHSPDDGKIQGETGGSRHLYPGELRDGENNSLIYKARAFVGKCLPDMNSGVVWFQTNIEEGAETKVVFAEDVQADDSLVSRDLPPTTPIASTLKLVSQNVCREIPPVKQIAAP